MLTSRWVKPSCEALARSTFEADFRLVDHLVDMHVGGAGNVGNLPCQLLGDLIVGCGLAPDYLQIERCGQTEVQNLGRDIGRLEEEDRVREFFLQAFSKQDFIVASGMVLLVQRNQDFAVGAGDGRDIALRQTVPTVRNSDVIDDGGEFLGGQRLPDFTLDGCESYLGFFNARSGWSASVQLHLAGVHIGKEVLADQTARGRARRRKTP